MNLLVEALVICVVGILANIVFKIGVEGFGNLAFDSFLDPEFYRQAFTTRHGWIVFFSLVVSFTGKLLIMAPMSRHKFGVVISILTPISLTLSVLAGAVIFHETYTWKEALGIVLAVCSVFLLGGTE